MLVIKVAFPLSRPPAVLRAHMCLRPHPRGNAPPQVVDKKDERGMKQSLLEQLGASAPPLAPSPLRSAGRQRLLLHHEHLPPRVVLILGQVKGSL